jgi:hypothetical protein
MKCACHASIDLQVLRVDCAYHTAHLQCQPQRLPPLLQARSPCIAAGVACSALDIMQCRVACAVGV